MAVYPKLPQDEYGSYSWLRREIGGALGFGYNEDSLDSEQSGKVDSIIQSGLMQFYYPPPIPGKDGAVVAHKWSFLTPMAELGIVSGTSVYKLPDDYSGIIGELTTGSGTTSVLGGPARISIVDEASLRQLEQTAPQSGLPKYAAVRPRRSDGLASQQWEVAFYPTPNEDRTLYYRYSIAPSPLSKDRIWPYGGKQHAETILQSCLAVAEERETKGGDGQPGPAHARFLERLAASFQLDMMSESSTEDGMWPLEDTPKDLTVDLSYLKRVVGKYMGVTSHPASWTHKQSEEVSEAIRSGLRRFYTPPVLPGEKYAHEWSFLRPRATLQITEDVYEYDLPDDFAFIDGPMTYDPGQAVLYAAINIVGEHQIRERRQRYQLSARPELAAIRVKQGTEGTKWEIVLWPTPDGDYSLHYRYRTNPGLLSSGIAKPAGGMPHAQTVIESCLLAADELMGRETKRYDKYIELLKTSVSHDRIASTPDNLGRSWEGSDGVDDPDYRDRFAVLTGYNGNYY